MTVITINGRGWTLGDTLGSGGFGRVYAAKSGDGTAAIKLIPKDPGAQRELLLGSDLSGVPNVVPIIGVGDAQDNLAILMPKAEQSLRDFLEKVGRQLEPPEALPILLDIAEALVNLSTNGVVHRDLKPENVLLLNDHWCLTDFGISRYAEAATAADTRKYFLSKPYAAPEQWRGQRATAATDVYALGVIAFEMLTGHRPFQGPDFRGQHLHELAPSLSEEIDTPLRSLIDECLTKAPQARPAPTRLLARLQAQSESEVPAGGAAALIAAHHEHVSRVSAQARLKSEAESELERRSELFKAATLGYERIRSRVRRCIKSGAPTVDGWPLRLGYATLDITEPVRSASGLRFPFDVIAYAKVQVDQSDAPGGAYCGRAHSFWYCDAREHGQYLWFETAFMIHPLMSDWRDFDAARLFQPFAAAPNDSVALQAVGVGMGTHQLAWPFTPLVDDDLAEFIDRWATWFADASLGRLQYPKVTPERPPHGSWRRA